MAIFDHLSGSPNWTPTITTPSIGSPITAQSIADGRQTLIDNDTYLRAELNKHAFLEFTVAYPDPGSSINSYWLKWAVDYDPESLIEQSPTYDYAFRIREPGYYLLHFNLIVDSSVNPTYPRIMFNLQNTNFVVSNAPPVHGVMSYEDSALNNWTTIFTGTSRHVYQTTTSQFRGMSIGGLAKGDISSISGNITIQKIGRWGA